MIDPMLRPVSALRFGTIARLQPENMVNCTMR